MPKEKKQPEKYKEKVAINVPFQQVMQILANHANTKGTHNITYKNRNAAKQ